MAGQDALSKTLAASQVNLLETLLHNPTKQELRDAAFVTGTDRPLTTAYVRKVGRPRHNWTEKVLELKRQT